MQIDRNIFNRAPSRIRAFGQKSKSKQDGQVKRVLLLEFTEETGTTKVTLDYNEANMVASAIKAWISEKAS